MSLISWEPNRFDPEKHSCHEADTTVSFIYPLFMEVKTPTDSKNAFFRSDLANRAAEM